MSKKPHSHCLLKVEICRVMVTYSPAGLRILDLCSRGRRSDLLQAPILPLQIDRTVSFAITLL